MTNSLGDDLQQVVAKIFRDVWSERDGEVVPEPADLQLGNDAVNLDATVLYADIAWSTKLVDGKSPSFAAEVYKTYMVCAARIIKNAGGSITAYDEDRIMAIFISSTKNSTAAKTAMQINWAVERIINPAIRKQYGDGTYALGHVIGIDTSPIFACRIGVREDNDIVWVGRAANYAAKLTSLSDGYPIYVTERVFQKLRENLRYGGDPKRFMWEARIWGQMNNMHVYRSNWVWGL
jgi:class 3 adenylate cyclase